MEFLYLWFRNYGAANAAPGFIQAPKVLGRDFRDFPPEWRMDLVTGNVNADTNQAGYQYLNLDLVTLAGGDLFGEVRLADSLSVYGTVAYVCGTNWDPVTFVDDGSATASNGTVVPIGRSEGLLNIYPLNGTLGVRLFEPATERWGLDLSSRLVAAQHRLATSLSELPTPAFATFALQGYYQPRESLRLTAIVENLLNTNYTEHGSLVILDPRGVPTFVREPGISVLLGMDGRF